MGLLSERVKEIFRKYGLTTTAIIIAVATVIGAVKGAITNSLKALGKSVEKGLQEIGQKTATLLPALIGLIVSFIFKAAEHTWLLIVVVFIFLMERFLKRKR